MNIAPIGNQSSATPVSIPPISTAARPENRTEPSSVKQANTTAASPGARPATEEEVKDTVKSMNDLMTSVNSNLQFSVDKDTGTTVVKLIDATTNEVIKQFPSEEMLVVAKAIDQLKGVFIKQQA